VVSYPGAEEDRLMADVKNTKDDKDGLESDARAAERLTFFSDAVIAIAITLLAIELPLPEGDTVHHFLKSVGHESGHYAAFLISFVAIAAAWDGHHDIFRYVRRVDTRARTLNTAWLLTIILTPFGTRLLTAGGQATVPLRFGFYALVQFLDSALLLALLRHMTVRRELAGVERAALAAWTWREYTPMLAFGLSIPVFFATSYGWVLWFAVPMALGRLHRASAHRRGPGPGGPGPDGPGDAGAVT
jgi:TMEM175 potassium channel family protein